MTPKDIIGGGVCGLETQSSSQLLLSHSGMLTRGDFHLHPFGNGKHTAYKNGDDWGMVYDCFTHIRDLKCFSCQTWDRLRAMGLKVAEEALPVVAFPSYMA